MASLNRNIPKSISIKIKTFNKDDDAKIFLKTLKRNNDYDNKSRAIDLLQH